MRKMIKKISEPFWNRFIYILWHCQIRFSYIHLFENLIHVGRSYLDVPASLSVSRLRPGLSFAVTGCETEKLVYLCWTLSFYLHLSLSLSLSFYLSASLPLEHVGRLCKVWNFALEGNLSSLKEKIYWVWFSKAFTIF